MFLRILLLFVSVLFSFGLFAQNADEKAREALLLLKANKYAEAEKAYSKILKENENHVPTLYGLSFSLWKIHTEAKRRERIYEVQFKNFQGQLDSLRDAFVFTEKARRLYKGLSQGRKLNIVALGVKDSRELFNLSEGISRSAADVLLKAPYNTDFEKLYLSSPYNQPRYADTLIVLRDTLIYQCSEYITNFRKTRPVSAVRQKRKELLREFVQIRHLRRLGTGRGYLYEKYCTAILEDFRPDELKHILPEFYGADYGMESYGFTENKFYAALKGLGEKHNMSILDFLCEMNMHYVGCHEENEKLYDDFIRSLAPLEIAFVAVKKMAVPQIQNRNRAGALGVYERYKSLFPEKANDFDKIISILKTPSDRLNIKNLGSEINTKRLEMAPVPTANETGLFFCRVNEGRGQDIYFAPKTGSSWKKAERLPDPVNTSTHEVPQSISFDGSRLVIFGNYGSLPEYKLLMRKEAKKLGKGDLYYSDLRQNGTWAQVRPFPNPVNSEHFESNLSLTADGKAAFFCSDRPEVLSYHNPKAPADHLYFHGSEDFNTDIFVCELKEDGSWSEPINVGETINTPFAEAMPFLHPDMKTLYFISDGHPGLGSADIFMSKRLNENSWTEWSEPVNLGKSVNTPFKDGFYISTTGNLAYVVLKKNHDTFGSYDIYSFDVPERFRPDPVLVLEGKITDQDGEGVGADVYWEDLQRGTTEGKIRSNPNDGSFKVIVPQGKHYGFYASKKGYFSEGLNENLIVEINDRASAENKKRERDLRLMSVKKITERKTRIRLNNIFFDFDKSTLKKESYPELDRLAGVLRENPGLKVRIEGHTDNKGKPEYNLQLSEGRAKAVTVYLQKQGVSESRLFSKGYGDTKPIANNETDFGRSMNRRVEFSLKEAD